MSQEEQTPEEVQEEEEEQLKTEDLGRVLFSSSELRMTRVDTLNLNLICLMNVFIMQWCLRTYKMNWDYLHNKKFHHGEI